MTSAPNLAADRKKAALRVTAVAGLLIASGCAGPQSESSASDETPAPSAVQGDAPASGDGAASRQPVLHSRLKTPETEMAEEPPAEAQIGPETIDDIEQRILATFSRIKSFRGRILVRFDSSEDTTWIKGRTEGTVEYQFVDGKVLYRFDMSIRNERISEEGSNESLQWQILLSDGEYMYQMGEDNGKKIAYKATIDPIQTSVPTQAFFDYFKSAFELRRLPDEQVNGHDTWVIEAARETRDEVLKLKTRTFFRKDVPIMVKTINYDRFGNVMQVTEIKDIEFDVPLNRERFKFDPEPGTEIRDQSR